MIESEESRIRRLIGIAERAVQGVEDVETRRLAFSGVLSHLLDRDSQGPSTVSKSDAPSFQSPTKSRHRGLASGPSVWVAGLIQEGFFANPRTIGDVVIRLAEVGHHVLSKDVSYPLARFCELHKLRRSRSGKDRKGRPVWIYTGY